MKVARGARESNAASARMQLAKRKIWNSVCRRTSQPLISTFEGVWSVGVRTKGRLLIVTVGGREVTGGDVERGDACPS
jgi:hypothetical protein